MKKSTEEFWLERYNKVIKENQNLREQNLELSVSLKSANEYMMYQQAEILRLQNDLCTLNNSQSDRLELALQEAQDLIKSQKGEITRLSNEVFLLNEQLEEKLGRIEELEIEQATARSKKEADRFNDLARTICGTQKYVNTSLNNPMSSIRKWPMKPKIIESSDESLDLSRSSSFALDDFRSEAGVSLYEEFFVVGYDYNINEAGIIYQFPGTNITPQNPIYRVLPQFVFPSGIKTRSLALRESASDLHAFLYGQTNTSRNSNFYIFTLKAPEGTTGLLPGPHIPNKNKDKLYCVCYSTDDLVAYSNSEKPLRSSSQSHMISNKVFCLLSFYPCFALHFEVLIKISNLKKYNRMCILAGSPNTPYDTRAMKSLLAFTDDLGKYATDILENYRKYDRLEPGESVKIDIPDGIDEPVDYTVPENLELIESEWLCPLLFSLLNLNDLYWLLMAAVQEKSIVFVSCSLAMVSSCVLGLNSLMRPFEWPYTILPLLPHNLRNLLEAPLPILVGYPGPLPNDYKTFPHIIWVNLDEINPKKRIYIDESLKSDIRLPSVKQLRSSIKPYYKHFTSDKPIYNPSNRQLQASEYIIEQVKEFWNSILALLPDAASFRAEGRFLDMDYILRFIIDRSPGENPMFLKNLVYSQLFMKYLDDKYSSQIPKEAYESVTTMLSTSSTEETRGNLSGRKRR